jgi:peptidoglycan/xylan/chitin deacetylase (PgdA/CDA1 family)
MVEWIVADGHEIGCHGWTHDWPAWLEPEVEEEHLDLQVEALTRLSGKRPKGYIAPGFEYSLRTFDLLLSRGFEYSADWLGEDVPYYIEHKGKIQDFVAVPSTWTVDDAAVYWFALFPALSYGAPYWEPSRVFELWTTEFDALYEEGAVYHLNMHPFLSGRGVRIKTLERVIQYIMQRPGVRFCSMEQMVEMYKQVVTPEQGLPGAWFPAKGDPAPKINPIDGIPIFS